MELLNIVKDAEILLKQRQVYTWMKWEIYNKVRSKNESVSSFKRVICNKNISKILQSYILEISTKCLSVWKYYC